MCRGARSTGPRWRDPSLHRPGLWPALTRYPLEPLVRAAKETSIYHLADRLGLSHQTVVELQERGLTEREADEYATGRLHIHPATIEGWRELWWSASELDRFVDGVPCQAVCEGKF